MIKWQQVKLGDIVYIKNGKLDSNAAETNGIYPFFTCDPQTLRINTWAYDQEAVLLAGNNASGNYSAKYYRGRFNAYQRTYIISSKSDTILLNRFLAYALNLKLQYLKNISSGATTKFLTLSMLNNLSINLPPIEIQRKIADVLSAYDDLIENNRKQIKLLEEAAQRLYKEWFIDFRFPGYETTPIIDGVPKGWERTLLGNLIDIKYGKDHKNIPDGNIPVYGSGGLMRKCSQALHQGEAVLIPRKGSLNNIMYVNENFWTVDTMFYALMKQQDIGFFVYFLLKSFDMYAMNIGAAVPSMTTSILNAIDVVLPSETLLGNFYCAINVLFSKISILKKQNDKLLETRNRLLKKLINNTSKEI